MHQDFAMGLHRQFFQGHFSLLDGVALRAVSRVSQTRAALGKRLTPAWRITFMSSAWRVTLVATGAGLVPKTSRHYGFGFFLPWAIVTTHCHDFFGGCWGLGLGLDRLLRGWRGGFLVRRRRVGRLNCHVIGHRCLCCGF